MIKASLLIFGIAKDSSLLLSTFGKEVMYLIRRPVIWMDFHPWLFSLIVVELAFVGLLVSVLIHDPWFSPLGLAMAYIIAICIANLHCVRYIDLEKGKEIPPWEELPEGGFLEIRPNYIKRHYSTDELKQMLIKNRVMKPVLTEDKE